MRLLNLQFRLFAGLAIAALCSSATLAQTGQVAVVEGNPSAVSTKSFEV